MHVKNWVETLRVQVQRVRCATWTKPYCPQGVWTQTRWAHTALTKQPASGDKQQLFSTSIWIKVGGAQALRGFAARRLRRVRKNGPEACNHGAKWTDRPTAVGASGGQTPWREGGRKNGPDVRNPEP